MFLGISDTVFIFSTMTKPIRSYLASHGIPNIIFIDDHLTGGANEKLAIQNIKFSNYIWAKAGWVMSPSKKQGPLKKILFLGLLICSDSMMFYIPEAIIVKLLAKADSLLSSKKGKLRVLASFFGLLRGRALGPIVRLMSRCMYSFLMSNVNAFSWNHLPLEQNVISEIRFWQENIVELNGFKFRVDLGMIADSGSRAFDQSSYSLDMPSFLPVIEFFGTPFY